ncbi:MAG TPA: hypothetical protein VNS34_14330 [Rhizobiaceae bacterium]|nr:hypothetical protein [Rhizobiaceae bacterium]
MSDTISPEHKHLQSQLDEPAGCEVETPEERRRRRARESGRRYRQLHAEQIRESNRRWKAANRDKSRLYRKRWNEANPEKARESFQAAWKKWAAANREKIREKQRRKNHRDYSLKVFQRSPDKFYRQILKLLPQTLPRHVRDDVASSLCLAIMERKVLTKNIQTEVANYLRAYNREYDTFKTVSLDETIPGTTMTRLDKLATR